MFFLFPAFGFGQSVGGLNLYSTIQGGSGLRRLCFSQNSTNSTNSKESNQTVCSRAVTENEISLQDLEFIGDAVTFGDIQLRELPEANFNPMVFASTNKSRACRASSERIQKQQAKIDTERSRSSVVCRGQAAESTPPVRN